MKKKIYQFAFVLMLSLTALSSQATVITNGNDKDKVALMSNEAKLVRIKAIELRVNEIKAMDKSTLNRIEKKELRNELRDMRKEAKGLDSKVYLSVGAIIIIILLLILIL